MQRPASPALLLWERRESPARPQSGPQEEPRAAERGGQRKNLVRLLAFFRVQLQHPQRLWLRGVETVRDPASGRSAIV